MDSNQTNSGRTYQQAMDDWTAQRDFLERSRNRFLHPPFDAPWPLRAIGYLMRLAALMLIPLVAFFLLLRNHGKSEEFSEMMQEEVARYLGADEVTATGVSWSTDGELQLKSVRADGGPGSFFNRLEALHIRGSIPIPRVFRKSWTIDRLNVGTLNLTLRSGAAGITPDLKEEDILAPAQRSPRTGMIRQETPLQTAGFGVHPDLTRLQVREFDATELNLSWGGAPSTKGGLKGAQATLTDRGGERLLRARVGRFSQGWLNDVEMESLSAIVAGGEVQIGSMRLKAPGGGEIDVKGKVTLGDVPLVEATAQMAGTDIAPLLPGGISQYLINARASGVIHFTGSVNKATGVQTDTDFTFSEGRLRGVPLLRAMQVLTGEDGLFDLTMRSGRVRVIHGGAETHGGIVLTVRELDMDFSPLARATGSFRFERELVQTMDFSSGRIVESPEDKISGEIRFGFSPETVAKINPALADRYFGQEEDGMRWIAVPVTGTSAAEFSKAIADELLSENRRLQP